MAATSRTRREKVPQVEPLVGTGERLTGELFQMGAELAGANSILQDILVEVMAKNTKLELASLNAHKLVEAAIRRIEPLAEAIEGALVKPVDSREGARHV